MSRFSTSRRLATSICTAIPQGTRPNPVTLPWIRTLSQSIQRPANQTNDRSKTLLNSLENSRDVNRNTQSSGLSAMDELAKATSNLVRETMTKARNMPLSIDSAECGSNDLAQAIGYEDEGTTEPYHFHIYSHKHNTHVTVTKPNRDAIISVSSGNLGFKKANRKHYDSAYQVGAYVIDRLHQDGWHKKIKSLEVVLRGFGPGREAVTKVLLGNEGRLLRNAIVRVADSTRLKFGGTRSRKKRRLG